MTNRSDVLAKTNGNCGYCGCNLTKDLAVQEDLKPCPKCSSDLLSDKSDVLNNLLEGK